MLEKDIGAQLLSSSIAADHNLPETKQGEQQGSDHKPSREGREASGIFSYQTFIFVFLAFGFIFMIAGLNASRGSPGRPGRAHHH
jgi:hypothetical protein